MISQPDKTIIGNYEIQGKIGSGSYSSVYKAIHKPTSKPVSIKVINKEFLNTERKKKGFFNEIEILKSLHHPFIVEFFDFFESPNHYYLVMEFIPNGNLHDLIKKRKIIHENHAKRLFLQIIAVLDYLHNIKHIIHRDLNSCNILLDKFGNIRIIDFGLSKELQPNNSMLLTLCGTPEYMAPEIILGQSYDSKCDIWSSGIILYEMLSGKKPFKSQCHYNFFKQIQESEPNYEGISESLTSLLQHLLNKNSVNRFSLSDIQNHPCFLFFDYSQILASTINKAIKLFEDTSIKNDYSQIAFRNYSTIQNQILTKEKMTDFLSCLNQITNAHFLSNLKSSNKSKINYHIPLKKLFIPQRIKRSNTPQHSVSLYQYSKKKTNIRKFSS
jgi:serine/threonine protein kinase